MDTPTPEDHNFNWVKATEECSVACEFALLQSDVQASASERNKNLEGQNAHLEFTAVSEKEFCVLRHETGVQKGVCFVVEDKKTIAVQDHCRDTMFRVTLSLSSQGQCRYQINSEGEYFRWEVARKALMNLFFTGRAAMMK